MQNNPFKEFEQKATKALREFATEAGAEVLNHFKGSWDEQGFVDKGVKKWPKRKPPKVRLYQKQKSKQKKTYKNRTTLKVNKGAKKAILQDQNRAILVGQERHVRLKNSLKKNVSGLTIKISTDKPYAQIHNEGGEAGRGLKAKIPQRQYMGESEELYNKLEQNFQEKMNNTFNSLPPI